MENAIERRVVGANRLELVTRYVNFRLDSSTLASLSGLETQWKGNSANKTSRSDKPAYVSWSLTLSLTITVFTIIKSKSTKTKT